VGRSKESESALERSSNTATISIFYTPQPARRLVLSFPMSQKLFSVWLFHLKNSRASAPFVLLVDRRNCRPSHDVNVRLPFDGIWPRFRCELATARSPNSGGRPIRSIALGQRPTLPLRLRFQVSAGYLESSRCQLNGGSSGGTCGSHEHFEWGLEVWSHIPSLFPYLPNRGRTFHLIRRTATASLSSMHEK